MGPKKKNDKTTKKKKDEKSKEQIEITQKLKLLLKDYEKQCVLLKSTADPALKATLKDFTADGKYLTRVDICKFRLNMFQINAFISLLLFFQ